MFAPGSRLAFGDPIYKFSFMARISSVVQVPLLEYIPSSIKPIVARCLSVVLGVSRPCSKFKFKKFLASCSAINVQT